MAATIAHSNALDDNRDTILTGLFRLGYIDVADLRLLFQHNRGDATIASARVRGATRMRPVPALKSLLRDAYIEIRSNNAGRSALVLTAAGARHCRGLLLPDARPGREIASLKSGDGGGYEHRRMATVYALERTRHPAKGFNEWSIANNKLPGVGRQLMIDTFAKVPDGLAVSPRDTHSGDALPVDWLEVELNSDKRSTFKNLAANLSPLLDKHLRLGSLLYTMRNIIIITKHNAKAEKRYIRYAQQAFASTEEQHGADSSSRVFFVRQKFLNGHYRGYVQNCLTSFPREADEMDGLL